MYFDVIFLDLKALFPLVYLVCLKAVEPNSAKPTTIAEWVRTESTENGGVIKAGTNTKYQYLLASKCYLHDNIKLVIGSLVHYHDYRVFL